MQASRHRTKLFPALAVILLCAHGGTPAQVSSTDSSARRDFINKLVAAAVERAQHAVRYDPAYIRIPYPGGDVPANTGVCTDEVIRVYRAVGVDLQELVHEDKAQNFSAYPTFGARSPDTNIDHRRVPNLMVFFSRKGESLPKTQNTADYSPGDLVTWDLGGNVPHIGIVIDRTAPGTNRHLILHNIGRGPKIEDVLFSWKITGHFRYFGPVPSASRPTP
jgi:uncharacterized protein